jgi:O-antigen ligase
VALILGESMQTPPLLRVGLTVLGSAAALVLAASVRGHAEDLRSVVFRGPNPWLLGLAVWAATMCVLSPFHIAGPAGDVSPFRYSEMLRVWTGIAIYFLIAYGLRSIEEITTTVLGYIGIAVFMALANFWHMGETGGVILSEKNLFGTHQDLGALVLLALPIPLAIGIAPRIEEKRRLVALGATIVLATALVLDQARSSWIGGAVALIVVAIGHIILGGTESSSGRAPASSKQRAPKWDLAAVLGSPATMVVIGLALVIIMGGSASMLKDRVSTLKTGTSDHDLLARVHVWEGASRMLYQRPLTGWGVGSYWMIQGNWTHIGDDPGEVRLLGAYQENNAHDYYMQWAADTGVPGVVLFCGALAALLFAGAVKIRETASHPQPRHFGGAMVDSAISFQRAVLVGALGAVAGACVDMVASPAYVFHGIYGMLWAAAGLCVVAMRTPTVSGGVIQPIAGPALPPSGIGGWAAATLPGVAVAATILALGWHQFALGRTVPRGSLGISLDVPGVVGPAQQAIWRATFHDAQGNEENTWPGTRWEFKGDPWSIQEGRGGMFRQDTVNRVRSWACFQAVAPLTSLRPLSVHATYYDVYGRRYDAWSEVGVDPKASAPRAVWNGGQASPGANPEAEVAP